MTKRVRNSLEDIKTYLDQGAVCIVPTETVYGLVAKADDGFALSMIFHAKGRDEGKPLPICIADLEQAETFGQFSELAKKLANEFWPGPLTIVVPEREDYDSYYSISDPATKTIAFRCPDIEWREILCSDVPLALTSANKAGEPAPTKADDVTLFENANLRGLLDLGPCKEGVASTIVSIIDNKVKILRNGPISKKALHEVVYGSPDH